MRLFLAIAALLASAAMAHANINSCQSLFKSAPQSLGGHALTKRENLEKLESGAGYLLQYTRHKAQRASIFLYDRGRSTFSTDDLATELSVSASQIYQLRAQGRNVTDGDVFFDRPKQATKGLFGLAFIYMEYDGRTQQNDYITLGVADGCLVKLIYSSPGARVWSNRRFDRLLDDLLRSIAQ
tara:strand:- start:62 stop:610 length:549 start_codon:yes stop_codon:yes gene_type:complete